MKWFRRRRRTGRTPFDASLLPPRRRPTFENSLDEGLMLAEYASHMALKNRIVVGVLTENEPYEPRRYRVDAINILDGLAIESLQAADRLASELEGLAELHRRAAHAHDYQAADIANLTRRRDVSRALAETLRERSHDEEHLLGLIERARGYAWNDIARAVSESLDRIDFVRDDNYEAEREGRMQMLIVEDLARLAAND